MNKIIYRCAAICVGLIVLASVSETQEVTKPQPSDATTKTAQIDRAFYPKNTHLVTLEQRLRKVVLRAQPDAKIEFIASYLVVHYHSEKFSTHLTNSRGNISQETPEQFPNNFSEFLLYLSVDKDVMHYRPDNVPYNKPETFGTTLISRYDLKALPDNELSNDYPAVPYDHWAYAKYDKLVKVGLLPDRYPKGLWNGPYVGVMSRYEFAVAIARLLDEPKIKAEDDDLDVKDAITALKNEFAPEISTFGLKVDATKPIINGQTYQPCYEHLSLRFSYGKGMDVALVENIKQVINEYTDASFKSGTVTINASAQK